MAPALLADFEAVLDLENPDVFKWLTGQVGGRAVPAGQGVVCLLGSLPRQILSDSMPPSYAAAAHPTPVPPGRRPSPPPSCWPTAPLCSCSSMCSRCGTSITACPRRPRARRRGNGCAAGATAARRSHRSLRRRRHHRRQRAPSEPPIRCFLHHGKMCLMDCHEMNFSCEVIMKLRVGAGQRWWSPQLCGVQVPMGIVW